MANYEDFLGLLHQKRSDLVGVQARLKSAEEAVQNEPQYVTLEQSISNEALLVLLAGNASRVDIEKLPELVSANQERNELYFDLKAQVVDGRSELTVLTSDIEYFEIRTQELKTQIKGLSGQIAKDRLNLERINRDIVLLSTNFVDLGRSLQDTQIASQERSGFIQIVESAVVPRVPVGPDRRRTVLMAGLGGLVTGVVMAFAVDLAQDAIRSRRRNEVAQDS